MPSKSQEERKEFDQVKRWSVYAQKRRAEEGVTGPWWELIPEEEKPAARAWIEKQRGVYA
jgi:hypothetical protein